MRITYSAAASQDGFIAREDGDVSWLDELNIDASETGLAEFFAAIDGLVMGRGTYDFVFDYGSWPYENKPAWVCTRREFQPMAGADLRPTASIDAVIKEARSDGVNHLWLLGGGKLASAFLAQGLITHLSIAEMPIKLGAGIPLFAHHSLDDLSGQDRVVTDKTGFRQIDVTF